MPLSSNKILPFSFLLLVILLSPKIIIYGQDYTIRSFTTADGLPHNNVRAIAKDSSGFIWIGTWDGLSRFDGHEFRNYFHEPDDSTSIPYFSVKELFVDRGDNLWILDDTRTLSRYNRYTDSFVTTRSLGGKTIGYINSVNVDQEGKLMILGRGTILVKDPDKPSCNILNLKDYNGNSYNKENEDNWFARTCDTTIWIMGSSGIRKFRKKADDEFILAGEFQLEREHERITTHFDYSDWYSFYTSSSGKMWIFSGDGIFLLDESSGKFREFSGSIPWHEFTGRKAFYWGKRGNGIFFYNSVNKKIIHIPDSRVRWLRAMMTDGSDSFWFSNLTPHGVPQGISMASLIPGFFRNTIVESPDSTTPAVYSMIVARDKSIWTGIRGFDNIVRFGPDGSLMQKIVLEKEVLSNGNYVRSLIPVPDGIWIGYYKNFLQFYNYETGKFAIHDANQWSYRAIATDNEGNIYTGTDKLSVYYPSTGKSEVLQTLIPDISIFKLHYDPAGILWAGMSNSRILKYDTKKGESSVIRVASGISNVEDIISGENGDLWLALLGKGVCRYSTATGAIRYYTTSKGLSNNTTYSLLKDHSGNIWVSTDDGISMINPVSDYIRTFDKSDGIAISEYNSGAKFISSDGEFFFGGMGGFIRFYPDSISLKETSVTRQKILFTDFRVSGESKRIQGLLNIIDTVVLSRGENNFHLYFSSSDFANSEKTIFRYMLSGINKAWVETGDRTRNINFTNLKPGWYDLFVEATDHNGLWTISRNVTIRIKPAFYQTRVFRIILPLLIIATVIFSIILYIRQIQQKERSKQDELKLQSLRSQMNPHFIFNSLNSINYFISNNDKLSANRYIADFSRLIRSILSNMGSNFIPLEDEISSLSDYLRIEHLRFSDKFDYNLDVSRIDNPSEIEVCPGIVQPFIENSIWHGVRALEDRKGNISIRFTQSVSGGLKCFIEDDGIGRSASQKAGMNNLNHKPKGISIIEERLQITGKLLKENYRIEISDLYHDREETGTRVMVDIPSRHIKTHRS